MSFVVVNSRVCVPPPLNFPVQPGNGIGEVKDSSRGISVSANVGKCRKLYGNGWP